jgi:hypothetical protein
LAEILKKHYFVKESIRIRSTGIPTVRKEKIWIAVQEEDSFQGSKHIYIHMCVYICVCVLYNATPSSQWQNPYFTKELQAEIELLNDHISFCSAHGLEIWLLIAPT